MAPVGVPVRVHEGGAQFSKKDKRERRSLDLDPSQQRQNTDGSGDREGVDKPDTPQPFGSRSPLPKRLKMRLERPEVPAEDIAARVDARLAAAERKREVRARTKKFSSRATRVKAQSAPEENGRETRRFSSSRTQENQNFASVAPKTSDGTWRRSPLSHLAPRAPTLRRRRRSSGRASRPGQRRFACAEPR